MLGEFKCNQHVFVDLFRKKFVFDIAIQMHMRISEQSVEKTCEKVNYNL